MKELSNTGVRKIRGRWSIGRVSAVVGASLGALVLLLVVLILVFGETILNGYGKRKMERALVEALPGFSCQIGALEYTSAANRLVARTVALGSTHATCDVGQVSLTGVRWERLLWGSAALVEIVAQASVEATNIQVEFPLARYRLRCARLLASVPNSDLKVEGTELRPLIPDAEFFAEDAFRRTRFEVTVSECEVSGLAYGALLQGNSCRAESMHISRPSLDALVNREKPSRPFSKSPLMVHEALAMIGRPFHLDRLSITNGHVNYAERVVAGADAAVLAFGAVGMSVENIGNSETSAPVTLWGQGNLMDAGTLKVLMSIPTSAGDLSLQYSGHLSAMALARLNSFLEISERVRIKSGNAQDASFEIVVTAGQARGRVNAIYEDLVVGVLDTETGTEEGLNNRVASLMANALKVRNANVRDPSGSERVGKVDYRRSPEDTFLEFVWFALWSGLKDLISH